MFYWLICWLYVYTCLTGLCASGTLKTHVFAWKFLCSLYRFPCIKFHSLKLIPFVMQMSCDVEHHWTPHSFSRHFCVIFAKIPQEKSNDCSKLVRGLRVDYFQVGSLWQRCLRFPWSFVWSWTQSLPLPADKRVLILRVLPTTADLRRSVQRISLRHCITYFSQCSLFLALSTGWRKDFTHLVHLWL